MPCTGVLCILQGSFDIPGSDSGKIVVCAGVFLQCSLDALYRGATRHFCRGLLDIPSAGAWKNRGMCPCLFCWLLVKKLISQKTLLGVVICAMKTGLLCSFKTAWSCVL